eukprot:6334762-Amphidinium_carterae.2
MPGCTGKFPTYRQEYFTGYRIQTGPSPGGQNLQKCGWRLGARSPPLPHTVAARLGQDTDQ